jgi:NADH-quinone oxidoreductase subunit N
MFAAFVQPHIDYHAFAPEIVLTGVLIAILLIDLLFEDRARYATSTLAGLGLLGSLVPILTLAVDGDDRHLFGGAYVVDNYALVLKALFLVAAYVVVLMSTDYIGEGDYYEGEYYFLLLSSLLGMTVMASARDLITIFIALETLSIPAYLLAGWRKRDLKGNEASLKYYLLGVFASGVMLYGMSLIFGVTHSTVLVTIHEALETGEASVPIVSVGILFVIIGFAFKVSAVPFHQWAPDTYEGSPTPITAFLSVASKAAGFVALLSLVLISFAGNDDVWQPVFWILSVLTMTVGNVIALRQTNVVRLLAYSSIAQAGYMLAPLAVASRAGTDATIEAIVTYLLIYAAMNLGAFAVVMAVARKTRSGELSSFGGLFEYAPGLTVLLTVFFFALAGIPPLGGWYAKLVIFRTLLDQPTAWAVVLAVIVGINSVVALFYYASIARETWMRPVPDDDRMPIRVPPSLAASMGLCAIVTVVIGVAPQTIARFAHLAPFGS